MDEKTKLLYVLRKLRKAVPELEKRNAVNAFHYYRFDPSAGICGNVLSYIHAEECFGHEPPPMLTLTDKAQMTLTNYIIKWPDRKDSTLYPVGGKSEYTDGMVCETLWRNPRRIELLDWLIDTFTEELENDH